MQQLSDGMLNSESKRNMMQFSDMDMDIYIRNI